MTSLLLLFPRALDLWRRSSTRRREINTIARVRQKRIPTRRTFYSNLIATKFIFRSLIICEPPPAFYCPIISYILINNSNSIIQWLRISFGFSSPSPLLLSRVVLEAQPVQKAVPDSVSPSVSLGWCVLTSGRDAKEFRRSVLFHPRHAMYHDFAKSVSFSLILSASRLVTVNNRYNKIDNSNIIALIAD